MLLQQYNARMNSETAFHVVHRRGSPVESHSGIVCSRQLYGVGAGLTFSRYTINL